MTLWIINIRKLSINIEEYVKKPFLGLQITLLSREADSLKEF
jgi:hypothetical protein